MPDTRGAAFLNGGQDEPPRFSRLSEKDQQDLAAMAERTGTEPQRQPVQAMFLVIIPEPGVAVAVQDMAAAQTYQPAHPASVPEMLNACHYVADRIGQSMLAQAVVSTQMQMGAAMQRQAEDAALVSKLKLN